MGRGNVCCNGDYEGLYYVDYDDVFHTNENPISYGTESGLEDFYLQDFINELKEDLKSKIKSFDDCDNFVGDAQAILENGLFYIVLQDNDWSVAVKLIQKNDNGLKALQKKNYKKYLNKIKECLFDQFEIIHEYAGPWLSGILVKDNN